MRTTCRLAAKADANRALVDLKLKRIRGAKVLRIGRETSGQPV